MRKLLLTFLLIGLVGCKSLGLQPADTMDNRIAYAYGTYTAVLQTAHSMNQAGVLTTEDESAVLALADRARPFLDSALVLQRTDQEAAGNKLALAVGILTQLQTFLRDKGAK